jgi:outer membrane lipoprotein-sorting protein
MIHANSSSPALSSDSAANLTTQSAPCTTASEILKRPALRPGVELVGKMNGVGFQDDQWLIQRNGRFIQTTELLYRIAEHANGRNTADEIARNVTDSTDWIVDAADVEQLISAKLVPLGLINTEAASEGVTEKEAPSPLSVNMRTRALSPRYIDPITKVFQIFCNRSVIATTVVISGLLHWWLYHIHGIGGSIRDAIYTPGGLLIVLAVIFAGAVFHEFGHASVLRSQGGKVGGMGFGLYLMYPAFYTDVTDSYRLGRWARVSTDLGGIYFHLIFVIALFGLFRITGREFLLFPVFLIDFEMVSQFIPLVRLDGYWLLADLTGVPDFFSLMTPFVRSLFPVPAAFDGNRLPPLRTWVKIVFAVYMLSAIPLLLYLFMRMFKGLPTFLSESWNALRFQAHMLSLVSVRTDSVTVALLVIQMVLLFVTVAGTVYLIWSVFMRPFKAAWKWAAGGTTGKKLTVVAATSCIIAVLALALVPRSMVSSVLRLRLTKAEALLDETREATKQLQSLRADVEGSLGSDHFTGTVVLKRPNLARIEFNGSKGLEPVLIVSDGTSLQTYFPADNQYVQTTPGENGENVQAFIIEQVDDFFRPERIGEGNVANYVREESVAGVTYEVVTNQLPGIPRQDVRYYISKADKLIHRIVITDDSGKGETSTILTNVQTNASEDELAFKWTAPPSAAPVQLPAGISLPVQK